MNHSVPEQPIIKKNTETENENKYDDQTTIAYEETTTVNDIKEHDVSFTGNEVDEQEGTENVDENGLEQGSKEEETSYDENETGTGTTEGENQYINEQVDDENAATTPGFIG